nr:helix-turn-helix transcriptional regulator [Oscillospiraceae bacterium]
MARIIEREKTNIVGEMVKYYRKERRMSQRALSAKLELMGVYVCRGSISRIEDGSRTVTDIEIYALAKALGVSINDLFSNIDGYIDLL